MAELSMKEKLEKFGIEKAIGYLAKNPEKNLPKLMNMVDKIDKDNTFLGARHAFHAALDDPDGNWYRLIMRVLHTVDIKMIQSFFSSFIMGATLVGGRSRPKSAKSMAAMCRGRSCWIRLPAATCTARAAGRHPTATSST